jgi:thioredoxin 1
MALEITDGNFNDTVASGVTLVDFWAPWCGPCQQQGPIVDKLAQAYEGKAKVGKLNVDENQNTAAEFGVMSIPTLLVFKDGEKVKQFVGLQSESNLKSALDAQLG